MEQLFLQSEEWEAIQRSVGRRTWRVHGILVIEHALPCGLNYLYCPRPVFRDMRQDTCDMFLKEVELLARAKKSIFLKIDPLDSFQITNSRFQISKSIQPEKTIIVDCAQSEDELLKAMHEKTRYNIRLGERKGVIIKNFQFNIFWKLLQETAKRDNFYLHSRDYYEKLIAMHSENFSNELFCAEYRGKPIATALVNFYQSETLIGGRATYLHGGSSREYKEIMAPSVLHWRIIQEARRRSFSHYDLGGVDENKWPGLTRFKNGFGGATRAYTASVDLIYRLPLYAGYRFLKYFRR